jgi:DNA-binding transcriptional LysR family regulator
LPKARQILCDAVTSEQQLKERFGGAKRTLRFGFIGPFLDDLVAPVVRELKQAHRGLLVALFDLPPRAQLDRLAARELDAALLANLEPEHRRQFAVRALADHPFAVALPEGHTFAGSESLALAALRSAHWVSLDDAFFPGRSEFLRSACAAAGFEPTVVAEVDSVAMMLGVVASGDVVALVPRHAEKLPHAGCVFVPLEPPVPVAELVLVTRRDEAMPELETLFTLLRAQVGYCGY